MKFPDLRFWRKSEEQRAITGLPWDVGGSMPIKQVSTEQALSLVPVFGAVRLLASQISTLPLQTYRKVGDGRVKIPTGSLFSQPAAHGTSYAWLHRCVTSLALRGNAYGLITARDNMGYPTMIEWLHPDHVQVQDQAISGPGSYSMPIWYWMGRIVPTEDLVHIAWFTVPYRVKGLSPIEACASVVSTGVSAQIYTADWFNNGAVPPGKFKNTQKTVSQPESDEIKARLNAAIRSRKPLVYGADWEYDPIAVGANEARFIETMQLNATQIASIYGIPPEMLGGSTGNSLTYSTVEQNSINFVKFTLRPWLELLEETFSQLLPRPQYVKFNVDALLRGDLTTRVNAYRVARDIGLNNIDELRDLEEYAPIPGGKGKDYDPLLVQVAAARGTEAAQIKANETPTDQPPANQSAQPPAQRSAEDDAGPKGWPSSEDDGESTEPRRLLTGAEAAVVLLSRRHDPSDPAAMRKFNPSEPRIPGGPHGGEWGSGGGAVKELTKLLKGKDVLDAAPAKLKRAPGGHHGDYTGEDLVAPKGHGSVRALSEYEGVEYVDTNSYLRHGPQTPHENDLDPKSAGHGLAEESNRKNTHRVAEIDKTMKVSPLSHDVEVHRTVKDGAATFGRDAWYGHLNVYNTEDFDEQDKLFERWEAGERPDLTGMKWSDAGYSSTSADPQVVQDFGKRWLTSNSGYDGEPIIMHLQVPKGTGGIQLAEWGHAAEILLERGLNFEVTADHGVSADGFRHLDVVVSRG